MHARRCHPRVRFYGPNPERCSIVFQYHFLGDTAGIVSPPYHVLLPVPPQHVGDVTANVLAGWQQVVSSLEDQDSCVVLAGPLA